VQKARQKMAGKLLLDRLLSKVGRISIHAVVKLPDFCGNGRN
jgi:hypothetical protein